MVAGTRARPAICPAGRASTPGPGTDEQAGAPVKLGNDVQVAVQAEVELGAGRDYGSLIGVFCGTGVGGGVVLDGKLWLRPRRRR